MLSKLKLNQLYFKDTQFANLMTRRIFNVLLIANPYDAFMLEDDGRIDEKIFNEYTSLSLRYPPALPRYRLARKPWHNSLPYRSISSSVCREREITTVSMWRDTSRAFTNIFPW